MPEWDDTGIEIEVVLAEDEPEFESLGPVIGKKYEEWTVEILQKLGFAVEIVHQPVDIKAIRNGRTYWFEVKGSKQYTRYLTKRQIQEIPRMVKEGQRVYIVDVHTYTENDERRLEFKIEPFDAKKHLPSPT
ncbi:MAG: hypothetical protein H3Z54_07125 [archaeon]|nr:hypothetical protein [archaeon]